MGTPSIDHMADKIVYVRDRDEWLWEWAVRYAERTRRPVSGVVLMALEKLHDEVEGTETEQR